MKNTSFKRETRCSFVGFRCKFCSSIISMVYMKSRIISRGALDLRATKRSAQNLASKIGPLQCVNFHENHTLTVHIFKISRRSFLQFSNITWNFYSKIGQFCASFCHKIGLLSQYPTLIQCSSKQFCYLLPLQCTSC